MVSQLIIFFFINIVLYCFKNKIIEVYNLYDFPDKKRKHHLNKTSIVGGLFFFINLVIYIFTIYLNKELSDFSLLFINHLNLFYFF